MNNLVKIVIPVYKPTLTRYEQISLEQNCRILRHYPITFVKPENLDVTPLLEKHPSIGIECFDDRYFQGIEGYNRLMTSPEFYERFHEDCQYILICQLDAYVFRDELTTWCDKGYDYIGAPWLVRPRYRHPLLRFYRNLFRSARTRATDFKVGTGGLSVRKVASHLKATQALQGCIREYLSHAKNHVFNEDVFFSIEVNKHGMNFRYPDYREALQFSFDKYPALCFEMNQRQLPFGCHSWYKRQMKDFWFPLILPQH